MEQDALVAINIGQFRIARAGGGVAGIVSEGPRLGVELTDIDHIGANSALINREFKALPSFIIGYGEGFCDFMRHKLFLLARDLGGISEMSNRVSRFAPLQGMVKRGF